MNQHIKQLAQQAGFCFDEYNLVQQRKLEVFSELLLADISTVVAAQALSNHSALEVFKNLNNLYRDIK